jgi:hypothetical protein
MENAMAVVTVVAALAQLAWRALARPAQLATEELRLLDE